MANQYAISAQSAGFFTLSSAITDTSDYTGTEIQRLNIPEGMINIGGNGYGFTISTQSALVLPTISVAGTYVLYATPTPTTGLVSIVGTNTTLKSNFAENGTQRALCEFEVYQDTDTKWKLRNLLNYANNNFNDLTSIADGSITNSKLAPGAVTDAKVTDVSATKITGTLGSAQLSSTASSEAVATSNIQDLAVTDAKISAVSATKITGTLTSAQIANLTILDEDISAVGATKITGEIATAQIANSAVTDAKISAVSATKITGTLSSAQLSSTASSEAIATANIQDLAVTDAKIADISSSKVTGTFSDSSIADVSTSKLTGTISNNQIAAGAITSDKLNAALNALLFKGTLTIPASGLPAANSGDYYKIGVAGTYDGLVLQVGDSVICEVDTTPINTPANWGAMQGNIDIETTLTGSNTLVPNSSAVKTYIDAAALQATTAAQSVGTGDSVTFVDVNASTLSGAAISSDVKIPSTTTVPHNTAVKTYVDLSAIEMAIALG